MQLRCCSRASIFIKRPKVTQFIRFVATASSILHSLFAIDFDDLGQVYLGPSQIEILFDHLIDGGGARLSLPLSVQLSIHAHKTPRRLIVFLVTQRDYAVPLHERI